MSAQEYYRNPSSRPLSPLTDATDTDGNHDRDNTTDADRQTSGVPERVNSLDGLNTLPSPSHQRIQSGFSDTSGYRGAYDEEEGDNPYKNYNMPDEESKEALVPAPRGRSSNYQDLGACFSQLFHIYPNSNFGWFVEYVDVNPIGQTTMPLMERGGKGKFPSWVGNYGLPLEQQIQNKQNGIGRQTRPYVGESNKTAHAPKKLLDADPKISGSVCVDPGHVGHPHLRAGV